MKKEFKVSIDRPPTGQPRPLHPGEFVRQSVLRPRKLSVLAAAKLVGVGRPAFSNFLNGKVSTTPEMAARIETTFGIPAKTLLDMQAAFDTAQPKGAHPASTGARPYVAPFLGIRASDIEQWADRNISARARLAVFLRTLVNSTGVGLTKVDFPGNDDAQRAGWDGDVEASGATPWIPKGRSGWEFGTDQGIKAKADDDFAKSVRATTPAERAERTFVFVTPRHWAGKAKWIKENRAAGLWNDVRAYDSSDLEQWVEQSIAAQTWFANETRRPSSGVRSLDKCWADWASVTVPPLPGSLFKPAIEGARRTMVTRLEKPTGEPTVITADSVDEALAFLAQLFGPLGGPELEAYRDRVLVFDEPGVLPKLAQGTAAFIAVASARQVERELGALSRSLQTIVVYPRNAANVDPHVVLQPLTYEAFRTSLEESGYGRDDVAKYDNESGRSLTVLRRRLATIPAVRTPEWAADHAVATTLVPFSLIGTWNSSNAADQTVLTLLADAQSFDDLEKKCLLMVDLNDPPLWAVGTYRGVISKVDLLYAIASVITRRDLERYFEIAKIVLGEDDPKLDLPDGQRWTAAIRGKSREFSAALRKGVSETLVLLAVHGNRLFLQRLGFDCELAVRRLIRDLLSPLRTRLLEANDSDLAAYAEAAPDEFLSILEEDLRSNAPECYGLLRPAASGVFGDGCPRTGLLWALEGLAWNPATLPRAALALAQLSQIEINDNWMNKPISSLDAIFRVWMPQTAADHQTRLSVLNLLIDRFPNVAWKVCLKQLETGHRVGHYSHKPAWRNDGYGYGEPFKTHGPAIEFMRDIADIVLGWKGDYTREMLSDLVAQLNAFDGSYQSQIWALVKKWASMASDADKATVREKIRVAVMSRRGVRRSRRMGNTSLSADAKAAYQALEPSDVLNKNAWLFRDQWIDESADETQDVEFDFRKHEERVTSLRLIALREVLDARGVTGIIALAEMGNAAFEVGRLMCGQILAEEEVPAFLMGALPSTPASLARKSLIRGGLRAIQDDDARTRLLNRCKSVLTASDFARLLLLAPFRRSTWLLVDDLDAEHRDIYWNEVVPDLLHDEAEENSEGVRRLLAATRPRAAFACVHLSLESLEPELILQLMLKILEGGKDQPGHYQLDHYYVEKAFHLLDASPTITLEQKASLEFSYIEILAAQWRERESYGIPNLEKYIERHPEFFVQAVVWAYKRPDGGEDPPEWSVPPDQVETFGNRGYQLLQALSRVPGHNDLDELNADNLGAWIKAVRGACLELGRLDIADVCIGRLLSAAPPGTDGLWPCEPVRQVMEDVHSKKMMNGAFVGLYNSRGVVSRGEGGTQERDLAKKYRALANGLRYSYPFVATELLQAMAEAYESEASHEDLEAGIRRRLR